ncbi:MAG: extracellular solute-binding protein [Butyrivibrio sp.]|nr:extracellular solute-binding protein [Butyrivibrio sp.]
MNKVCLVKRIAVCFLASLLFVSSITGCGKKNAGGNKDVLNQAKVIDKDHIFKEEEIKGIIGENSYSCYLDYVGGKIKCIYVDEGGKYTFVSADTNGTIDLTYEISFSEKNVIPRFTLDESDNLYMFYDVYPDDESDDSSSGYMGDNDLLCSYLVGFDNTGKELFKETIKREDSEEYNSCNIVWTPQYGLLICSNEGIQTYSEQNGFSLVLSPEVLKQFEWGGYIFTGAGYRLYVEGYTDQGMVLMPIDLDNKKLGEPSKIFEQVEYCSFFGGEGYDLYASNENFIYGYDSETDKLTELVNIVDSELGIGYGLAECVAVSDTEIIATIPDQNSHYYVAKLSKVKPEDIKEKTVITLGGVYVDYDIVMEAYRFNKKSDEYRIKVVDYSEAVKGEDLNYYEILKKFNVDILSGKAPDIIAFGPSLDVNNYINKGVLMDLSPLFDKGGALENIEVLPNIFEMMHVKDKIYYVFPGFTVSTMVMRNTYTGGKTTLSFDDCDAIIKERGVDYKTAFGTFSKNSMLDMGISYSGNMFIDWENRKCNFNGPEFIELLNFANKFPQEIDYDNSHDYYQDYIEDKSIFLDDYIYGFDRYGELKNALFKDEVAFIGFPNGDAENMAYINPQRIVGINSKSEHTDIAVEFIKSMFETYNSSPSNNFGFPVDKKTFEAYGKAATEEKYKTVNGKQEREILYYWIGDNKTEIKPLSEAEVQRVSDYILSIDKARISFDGKVSEIINEEASAFFSGQKSVEEVADIIQSRVSTYISENS